MNKLVSVIVACHNASNYLDLCLQSLVEQTYKNIEIIVCDDASTDDSYDKLCIWKQKYSRIKILKNEDNLFAAATRNRCIKESNGEYLMIQDIDDLSSPMRTEILVSELQKGEVDFVSSAMQVFDSDPCKPFKVMKPKIEYPTKKDFLWKLPFYHAATMFLRKCIEAVGGYRVAEETRRGQDYDIFMRMYAQGFRGKNIFQPLYIYRLDDANIKRRTFKARMSEYKIRLKGFSEMGLMPFAYPFVLKPFVAHLVQKIKYLGRRYR